MSEEGQGQADDPIGGGGDSPKAPSLASGGSSAASSVASAPPSVTPRLSRPISGDNTENTGTEGEETPPPPPLPPAPDRVSLPDTGGGLQVCPPDTPPTVKRNNLQNGGGGHYKTEVCLHNLKKTMCALKVKVDFHRWKFTFTSVSLVKGP